jgi:hypothetical protein
MADQPHLQFFDPDPDRRDGAQQTFHLFPQLVPELRLKIWRHAFRRRRIVEVHLTPGSEKKVDGETDWFGDNIDSTAPQRPYGVYVSGYQLMSKFLRVSRESRAEVLRFYRVHIPCLLTAVPQDFCEEFDIEV